MHQEKCDMSLVLFTNNLSSLVLLFGCARRGVVPTAACNTISHRWLVGARKRKKKMEEKNYTWESSGRWCLNGLPTSCSYFLYFAMQSSLPIILHLHSTCCLWRMPRVHSGKCITRLVTWVVCALSVGLHSTLYTPHTQRRQVEKKRVAQRAANNIPFVTPLRTFTSCDTCAVIICECIRKAVRRLFVMCWHVCVYRWCSRIRSCAYTKCEIKGECVILTSTLYPRLHKYSVLSSCFGSNVTFHPKASRSGQETGRKRESTLSAKRAYHWKVSTSRGELLIVGHFSTLLIYCCSHKRDIYHLNILHVS